MNERPNEVTTLTADESWVIQKYRDSKKTRFATVTIEVHEGLAEFVTVTEKFKRGGILRENERKEPRVA